MKYNSRTLRAFVSTKYIKIPMEFDKQPGWEEQDVAYNFVDDNDDMCIHRYNTDEGGVIHCDRRALERCENSFCYEHCDGACRCRSCPTKRPIAYYCENCGKELYKGTTCNSCLLSTGGQSMAYSGIEEEEDERPLMEDFVFGDEPCPYENVLDDDAYNNSDFEMPIGSGNGEYGDTVLIS